jgi:O-antigen ligase
MKLFATPLKRHLPFDLSHHLQHDGATWLLFFKIIFVFCLSAFPLFMLTQKGWVSALGFVGGFSACVLLLAHSGNRLPKQNHANKLAFVFCLPILAIALSQCIRNEWLPRDYDGPARLLLAIPVIWVIAQHKVVRDRLFFIKALGFILPAMLYVTWVYIFFKPYSKWAADRITTYFVDPLTFGSLCLTAGLLALASINVAGKDKSYVIAYKALAFPVAVYLSLLSGSRTGWLAMPIVLLFLIAVRSGIKLSPRNFTLLLVATVIGSYLFLSLNVGFYKNILLAVKDITDYHWDTMNLETPVGMRLSDLRMGFFYFSQSPFAGWGDTGFKHLVNAPEISIYANQFTRDFAYLHGFHNEITTNMVRSGIWGLVSSTALFVAPFVFFVKQLKAFDPQQKKIAVMATCYMICVILNSMTTEVLNIKFTASFFALMMAVFIGTLLQNINSDIEKKHDT